AVGGGGVAEVQAPAPVPGQRLEGGEALGRDRGVVGVADLEEADEAGGLAGVEEEGRVGRVHIGDQAGVGHHGAAAGHAGGEQLPLVDRELVGLHHVDQ